MCLPTFEGTELVFQLLVGISNGEVKGYEVLSRPGGDESIEDFLAKIETTGSGIDFDKYVLSRVKELMVSPDIFFGRRLYVNVSASSMSSKEFYYWLKFYLAGLPSKDHLGVEITEHEPLSNLAFCQKAIDLLAENQVPVSLDDVPSGHMTLEVAGTLKGYSALKLDREVISGWKGSFDVYHAGQSVLDLATQRQLSVVAEGLDSIDKVRLASSLGISLGQGFLLGYPTSPPEKPEVITRRFLSLLCNESLG